MTVVYIDATSVIALGDIGELRLFDSVGKPIVVLPTVRAEGTSEPARANLDRWMERQGIVESPPHDPRDEEAKAMLNETAVSGDFRLVGAILAHRDHGETVGIVSDDRRIRTLSRGLGATVTGTIGVLVRAVDDGLPASVAKRILTWIDDRGLHMTAELRERAERLIEDAAKEDRSSARGSASQGGPAID